MAKQGRRVVWCESCGIWFTADVYDGTCHRCGLPVTMFRCIRCGHRWKPRDTGHIPVSCPKCCSPYAFYTRVRDAGKKKDGEE